MKYVLIALAVAAMCVPAFAGYNPSAKVFVHIEADASPDAVDNFTVVNEIPTPTAFTSYYAYIGLTEIGLIDGSPPPADNGFTTVSFLINDIMSQYPGVVGTQSFVNLLPGNLGIGDAFVNGITIASTECMLAPFQYIGYVQVFYLTAGGACTIEVLDHVDYPRWVVDCQEPGLVDFYCVWKNGALGMAAPTGDSSCEADTPVEDATWGAIKALYR
jgi:hypothetical protein